MPRIGIERDQGLFYEGEHCQGHIILPTPVTAPAAVITEKNFPPKLPPPYFVEEADTLFREDSFDAVTRVRRGRLYSASVTRPEEWQVFPHPNRPAEMTEAKTRGTLNRRVFAFQSFNLPDRINKIHDQGGRPLVVIGNNASFSIWTISSVEGLSNGEFLVTLRGRQTFGALPEINLAAIPDAHRLSIQNQVAKLRDEIFRAGPGSVVDRARDLASAAISAYLQHISAIGPGKELDELIKKLNTQEGNQKKHVAAAAAEIVRIFHSREKPSVRERLPVSPVREQEAELAVYCVGSILCEFGWADWS